MDNHRDNKTYSIENLLASGETPESIYQSALKITQEQEKKKKEQLQKEIDRRRDAALKALYEYIELVDGKPVGDAFKKTIENDFKNIERMPQSKSDKTKEKRTNLRGEPLDPAFEHFLEVMGLLDD